MEITEIRRERLRLWFANKTLPQKEKSYISQLMGKSASFGERAARRLERDYGMGEKYLDQPISDSGTQPGPNLRGKVPLISWVQAGQWCEISDQFQPGDAESWRETTAKVSSEAFALRIIGDSMEPAIPRGSVVIVDPAIEATNGRIVVVRQNGDSEATIKRLVIEGGVRFLQPDNPRYPIMEMRTDAVICGVAIKVELDL